MELSIPLLVKEMRLLMMLQMLLSGLNRLEVILIMSLIMKMKKRLQLRRLQQKKLQLKKLQLRKPQHKKVQHLLLEAIVTL